METIVFIEASSLEYNIELYIKIIKLSNPITPKSIFDIGATNIEIIKLIEIIKELTNSILRLFIFNNMLPPEIHTLFYQKNQ